jgi:putative endonuclease
MNYRQKIGKFGEKIACQYLRQRGYVILGTNLKLSFQEIDIVAKIGDLLVFIEVKTRVSDRYGGADDAMFGRKIDNFRQGIELYLENNKKADFEEFRADFIAINVDRTRKIANISHYKDII